MKILTCVISRWRWSVPPCSFTAWLQIYTLMVSISKLLNAIKLKSNIILPFTSFNSRRFCFRQWLNAKKSEMGNIRQKILTEKIGTRCLSCQFRTGHNLINEEYIKDFSSNWKPIGPLKKRRIDQLTFLAWKWLNLEQWSSRAKSKFRLFFYNLAGSLLFLK